MKIILDLLPEQKKLAIKRKKIFGKILREEVMFLFPLIVFIFILLDIYYILTIQKSTLIKEYSMQQEQSQYKQMDIFEEKFRQINDMDQQLKKIQENQLKWSNLFKELSAVMPSGVYINDLATKDYAVFLSGEAKSRDDLLDFKNKLENSVCFQEVNVPLSNLVVKDNVVFQLDLKIKKECLKK
jgi:Tfp pilus assembly protein PilN